MITFRKMLIAAAAIAAVAGAIAATVALSEMAPPYNDVLAMATHAVAASATNA